MSGSQYRLTAWWPFGTWAAVAISDRDFAWSARGDGGKSAPGLQEPQCRYVNRLYRRRHGPRGVTACRHDLTAAGPGLRPDGPGAFRG